MNYLRFNIQLISIIIVSLIQVSWVLPILNAMEQNEMVIFDFKNSDKNENWIIVNDGVMGGLSNSEFFISNSKSFKGTLLYRSPFPDAIIRFTRPFHLLKNGTIS